MNGHVVLRETAELIRRGWCCGADARDKHGKAVAAFDPADRAWSLTGALVHISEAPGNSLGALGEALWGIAGVIDDSSLDDWNNAPDRTQAETLTMLADAATGLGVEPALTAPSLN